VKKRIIYLGRFSNDSGLEINNGYAGNRKNTAISHVLSSLGYCVYKVVCPDPRKAFGFRRMVIRRQRNYLYVTPTALYLPYFRGLVYLLNSFLCAIDFFLLARRKNIHATISYNLLPDTVFAAILLKYACGVRRSILQFEERQKYDIDAALGLKVFESIFIKTISFYGVIAVSSKLSGAIDSKKKYLAQGLLPDYFRMQLDAHVKRKLSSITKVAFVGRFDSGRGIWEYLNSIEIIDIENAHIEFYCVGYGASEQDIKRIMDFGASLKNAKLRILSDIDNNFLAALLAEIDIFVSLVTSPVMLLHSFPSKLLEFLYLNRLVISQKVDSLPILNNIYVIRRSDAQSIANAIIDIVKGWDYFSINDLNGRDWVLRNATEENYRRIFLDLLPDIS